MSSGEASLGESIAQTRDDAGLTIEQVAERTRIRATVIRAIENDDFSLSGGDVYAKGHLRSIAQVLKTDPAPLLARFDEAHGVPAPTVTEVFEAETSTQRERRGANWSAVMAAALVIAVGLVAVQVFRADSDGSRQTTVIDNPTPEHQRPRGRLRRRNLRSRKAKSRRYHQTRSCSKLRHCQMPLVGCK